MTEHAELARRVSIELDELRESTAVRRALEMAARAVEALDGGRHYRAAFKAAARRIRALKPD